MRRYRERQKNKDSEEEIEKQNREYLKWLNRKYDEDTKKVKEVYRNIKKNDQLEMQNYLDKLAKDEESPVRFEKVIRKSKIKEEKEELLAENIEKSV